MFLCCLKNINGDKMYSVEQNIIRLKEKLNINWNDEGLLRQALTHGSHTYENKVQELQDNQRLEFLGDAVLELIISNYLYHLYPESSEGELTRLRSALVCEPSLAKAARDLSLGNCLLMGKGEERSGGRNRPSILADAFEALLGAIFLDQGLAQADEAALTFLKQVIDDVLGGRAERDYKTELQELLQQKAHDPVSYIIISEKGPDHNKVFTAGVVYHNREIGRGAGHSKKEAEQQAARQALLKTGI
jgi:ribonuclease-3